MAKLIVLFPHEGDDGVRYEPGMHREVEDHLVEAYLRPAGNLELYAVFEVPKPRVSSPVYNPPKDKKPEETSVGGLVQVKGPDNEVPAPKTKKK